LELYLKHDKISLLYILLAKSSLKCMANSRCREKISLPDENTCCVAQIGLKLTILLFWPAQVLGLQVWTIILGWKYLLMRVILQRSHIKRKAYKGQHYNKTTIRCDGGIPFSYRGLQHSIYSSHFKNMLYEDCILSTF
jgi:hypothetical protein